MAQGRLSRSTARYPGTRRRHSAFATSHYGHRGRGLPPHLMPGIKEDKKPETVFSRRNFVIAIACSAVALFLSFIAITVTSAVSGAFAIVREYRKVNSSLPDAGRIFVNTFQTTRIFDRKGKLLQEIDNPDYGWRTFIPFDQMPQDFINATVAAEDATFWTNKGIEPIAFVRAGLIMFTGSGSSGASTITQQLVRATYPDDISADDISVNRKFREALAAVAMAQEYSKEDIFTMYVNQIYYGARSYGVEAAANTYFNKHASELTLAESAILAGIPQQPSRFTLTSEEGFPLAKQRQGYVLDQMQKLGYITRAQREEAWAEPLNVVKDQRTGIMHAAPHFTQYMHDYIAAEFGQNAIYAGLNVYTSIDLDLQSRAEDILRAGVADATNYGRNNGALVVICPWNGEILTMVGSADFNNPAIDGQVNFATSHIQPGSSMKPIAYAAAFSEGWHPGYVVMDCPTEWEVPGSEPYAPNNYSKLFYGAVSIRRALANSFNIGAVKATEWVGVAKVMETAKKMGMETSLGEDPSWYGVALGLGAGEVQLLEHTNCYATFANNGTYVPVTPIQRVEDSQGNVVRVTDRERIAAISKEGILPGVSYQITSILTDNNARSEVFGENNLFGNTQTQLGRPTAAKSGTTENWRDTWTMGYSTACAVGVWVGRSGDGGTADLPERDGIQLAGPIWQNMMYAMHDDFADLLVGPDGNAVAKDFPVPDDVSKEPICKTTGHRPGSGETVDEWIVRGLEPTLECDEMNDWESEQLNNALEQVDKGANWAEGAQDSILRYASVVKRRSYTPSNNRDSSNNNSSGSDSNNSGTTTPTPTSPPIEPIAPGGN